MKDKETKEPPFMFDERKFFRVYMCMALGEDPEDHGLTLEEVDFICYWMWDNDNQAVSGMKEGDFLFPNGYHEVFRARGVDSAKLKNTENLI